MPFGLGLSHFVLLPLDGLGLLLHALVGTLKTLIESLYLALMMPVGTEGCLAAIVDVERPMVDHRLEAEFLHLVALAVHPWPLTRLQALLDLRGAPVHQGLALWGDNDHKVPGIIGSELFPRPARDLRAIFQGSTKPAAKLSRPACSLSSSMHSKPKPWASTAWARATALTARSITNRGLPVASATFWQ